MAPALQRFGEKLRTLRKSRQMTLLQLAEALDYSTHSYLSELESNKKLPPVELVLKVARLFDVTTDQLLKDELDISTGKWGDSPLDGLSAPSRLPENSACIDSEIWDNRRDRPSPLDRQRSGSSSLIARNND